MKNRDKYSNFCKFSTKLRFFCQSKKKNVPLGNFLDAYAKK